MDENIDYLQSSEFKKATEVFENYSKSQMIEARERELMFGVSETLLDEETQRRKKAKELAERLDRLGISKPNPLFSIEFNEEHSKVHEVQGEIVHIESLEELQAQLNPNLVEEIMKSSPAANSNTHKL